jgi:hypothetical protein
MAQEKFEFGDRVRHQHRPEWGIGSVTRIEVSHNEGKPTQRLTVRFPNAGLKVLNGDLADLERVVEQPSTHPAEADHPVAAWDRLNESEWLGSVARRKVEEAMVRLTLAARDPFRTMQQRLTFTLDLYRFDRGGRSLIDWAVAQSGLDDPLTRFTRHELELLFDRWASERDNHLSRLLTEMKGDPEAVRRAVAAALPAGKDAVRRITAFR